mmetsp:Transcript_14876/g.23681  ORF Transcript_14876/g.23681 Transcript_14876/m.23681 type:complete len:138 (+) Transcript_14876:389-802(+)
MAVEEEEEEEGRGGVITGRNEDDCKHKLEGMGGKDGETTLGTGCNTVLEVDPPHAKAHSSNNSSSSEERMRRRGRTATISRKKKEERGISFVEWMLAMQEVDVPLILSQFIPHKTVGITIAYAGLAVVLSRLHYTDD